VRAREIAVRKAIGASQSRLVRQVMTESLVLAGLAAAAGVLLARWLTGVMAATAPSIPRLDEVRLDPLVLAYTVAVSVATALVFGCLPAAQLAGVDAGAPLRAARGSRSSGAQAVRRVLVAAQVGTALVLLVGAVLLLQSFSRLVGTPSGFRTGHVLTFRVSVPEEKYVERERVVRVFEQVIDRVRSLPGVVHAGAAGSLPLQSPIGDWDFYLQGETPNPHGSDRAADWQVVTPGYFEAMGIPLLRGRFLDRSDRADAAAAVVINESLARTYFAGQDPVGRSIRMSGPTQRWMRIVGVCADVRHEGLETPANAQLYIPHAQFVPFWRDTTMRSFAVVARTSGEPLALASIVRAQVREIDRGLPASPVTTMTDVLGRSLAPRRLPMLLLAGFGAVAFLLALIGTYGVLAYHVADRTREIGVRMALGARAADIVRMVVRQGMGPAAAGVLAGLAAAAALARTIRSLLFQTSATDPATLGATAVALLAAALLACVVPALRAARVDPNAALRSE
jgi:putative ABC transport system permease protein